MSSGAPCATSLPHRSAFRAGVDDGFGDDVEVVFDQYDAIARSDKAVQDVDELFDVGHAQANGRFVEHVESMRACQAAFGPAFRSTFGCTCRRRCGP